MGWPAFAGFPSAAPTSVAVSRLQASLAAALAAVPASASGTKRMPAATAFKDRLFIQPLPWRCPRIPRHPRSRKGASRAAVGFGNTPRMPPRTTAKGLRLFLDAEQQRAWLKGEATPTDGE